MVPYSNYLRNFFLRNVFLSLHITSNYNLIKNNCFQLLKNWGQKLTFMQAKQSKGEQGFYLAHGSWFTYPIFNCSHEQSRPEQSKMPEHGS